MKFARVIEPVVTTQKHAFYRGQKLLLVQPLDLDRKDQGRPFVAIDRVQAGVGDFVLLMQEGSSARFMVGDAAAPVRSAVVGIVDHVDM